MADYEVTDPNGIEYRPAGGGAAVKAGPGEKVSDLTDEAAEWLLSVGAIGQPSVAEQAHAGMARDTLDAIARDAGVADPEGLPNRQAVVDAIETMKEGDSA